MPKVLIVNDDASFRFMLESRFAEAGYTVGTAGNGNQCAGRESLDQF